VEKRIRDRMEEIRRKRKHADDKQEE